MIEQIFVAFPRIRIYYLLHLLCMLRFGFANDDQGDPNKVYVPTCSYNSKNQEGLVVKGYNDQYCNPDAFQPTFNEWGMCYTFNNFKQGMDEYYRTHHAGNILENNGTATNVKPTAQNNLNGPSKLQKGEDTNAREILNVLTCL